MISRLIATGSLLEKGYLFWDEPETNLNPRLIKLISEVILDLCSNGIQVLIATHSLFLLRELDILILKEDCQKVKSRFFALDNTGRGVSVQQGDSIDDIEPIASLDESLMQSDRYLKEL